MGTLSNRHENERAEDIYGHSIVNTEGVGISEGAVIGVSLLRSYRPWPFGCSRGGRWWGRGRCMCWLSAAGMEGWGEGIPLGHTPVIVAGTGLRHSAV